MSFARTARSFVDVDNPGLVWLVSTTHGANEFFSIVVPPLFPFLVPSLGIGYADASLLVVTFFVTYSVVQLPVGRLADVWSERLLLALGMAVLAVGIGTVSVAPTFPLMVAGMVLAGIGGSTYHPTGMAVISDAETDETHGRSMGIHGALGTFGSMLAPLLMTAIAATAGWRTALRAASLLGVGFAAVLYLLYPRVDPRDARDRSFRSAAGEAFGEDLDLGVLAGRIRRYVLSPSVLALAGLFFVVGAEVRAVQTWTPVFASSAVGADPAYGNFVLALTMVAAGVTSAVAGYGVDRADRRVFTVTTFLLTALVVAGLTLLPVGRLVLPVGFVVLGVVMYAVYPASNALAAAATTDADSGSLFGVTNTASALGGAAGPFLLGVLADATGIGTGFLATTGIALAGVAVVAAGWSAFGS
ncbi:MFS transporter [Halorussus sp. AFM4]|uniref:MFS transporter n=1 Tax=Halorussus sp. AFM4 TaxID=3421651 RepID=UPI003EBAA43E